MEVFHCGLPGHMSVEARVPFPVAQAVCNYNEDHVRVPILHLLVVVQLVKEFQLNNSKMQLAKSHPHLVEVHILVVYNGL